MDAYRLRSRLPAINGTVVAMHGEELSLLAANRPAVVQDPHRRLDAVADHDERLVAHGDGILLAGHEGAALAIAAFLEHQEPGEAFVLAWACAARESMDAVVGDVLRQAIADSAQRNGLLAALASALAWRGRSVPRWLEAVLDAGRRRQIRLLMADAQDARDAVAASDLLADDPALAATACGSAAWAGRQDLAPICRRLLCADDADLRCQAAWSLALLSGDAEACTTLRWFASAKHPQAEPAAILAARRLPAAEGLRWIAELQAQPAQQRIACIAAGAQGDPVHLPWLIGQMRNADVARVAGEAFSMITGADLAYLDLDGDAPEGWAPPEPVEDAEAPMTEDPDGNLPWPHAERVAAWLARQGGVFAAGRRHLCGRPIDAMTVRQVLRDGFQRQRAAAALEWACLEPERPLFDVTAPAWRQRERLQQR